jgi:hypothetical protein
MGRSTLLHRLGGLPLRRRPRVGCALAGRDPLGAHRRHLPASGFRARGLRLLGDAGLRGGGAFRPCALGGDIASRNHHERHQGADRRRQSHLAPFCSSFAADPAGKRPRRAILRGG